MYVAESTRSRPCAAPSRITEILREVSPSRLRAHVEMVAFPRHYERERRANRRARDLIRDRLCDYGYDPVLQGAWDNVIAGAGTPETGVGPRILLGSHYDTVPGSPGADDNGSAVAVCLEIARILGENGIGGVTFAFFNREEDGLLGSRDFVRSLGAGLRSEVSEAHIFEMVGFRSHAPGSQHLPEGLPIRTRDTGDFLAVLSNSASNRISENVLSASAAWLPDLPVLGLRTLLGVERFFPHLLRSDHAPFWEFGVPALMWTDTSEFRNPHYHEESDTPETLDYHFLADVTRIALAHVLRTTGNETGGASWWA